MNLQNNLSLSKMKCRYVRCGGKGKVRTYEAGKRAGRRGISQVSRTEELLVQFEEMQKRYIRCKGRISISSLYEDLCMKYYSTKKVVGGEVYYDIYAAANRPTKRQLYYYMQTNCSQYDRYVAAHGEREAWNNKRALHSDSIANLPMKSIGSRYEMDEMETGILTFVDDEGNDVRFEILDVVTLDEKEYLVVLPVDDVDSGVLILEIKQENGEEVYDTVTDDEEAEKVFNKFQEEYGEDEEEMEDEE